MTLLRGLAQSRKRDRYYIERQSEKITVHRYCTLNALSTMALGLRPAGISVNSDCVEVRTTAMSPERLSATKSKCPAAENASAPGPSPTWIEPMRLPSSMEYTLTSCARALAT